MNVVMIVAVSEDGYITAGEDPNPSNWTSDEDRTFYQATLNKYNLYLMGHATYKKTKNTLPAHAYKIVMTHNASEQPSIPNTLFTNKSFTSILQSFSARHTEVLVIGGASIYNQLLNQQLIDEALVTVEPVLLHRGTKFMTNKNFYENYGFALVSKKILNQSDTTLYHYVLKK